jgi:DNA polymerase-3 subunit epsilon
MLLLSLDFETTGLDRNSDRVTEVGAVLHSTTQKRDMMVQGYFVDNEVLISEEITRITGIKKGMIDKFGLSPKVALMTLLSMIDLCDAIVGQNIVDFDMPFLENWAAREKETIPPRLVIDTKTDLPGAEAKHLGYMAADHGFLNPFPHNAVPDCMTVLKLVSFYDIDQVVARAKSPRVYLQAHVNFDNNHLAKKLHYKWNPEMKIWWKVIKELDLDAETKAAQFDVQRIAPVPFH